MSKNLPKMFMNELDDYGFALMQNNNLLNEEGKITVVDLLYQPEDFTQQILFCCRKKYASLGEQKTLSECIITFFYGSLCATMFYSKNKEEFLNKTALSEIEKIYYPVPAGGSTEGHHQIKQLLIRTSGCFSLL